MTVRNKVLPVITSEDISRYPDQASYKINTIVQQLRGETIEREEGDDSGSAALQQEIQDRIDADNGLSGRIDDEALTRATDDGVLQGNIDTVQSNLNAEALTRAHDDGALQTQITNLVNSEIHLTLSTTDIGTGAPLAANTLYGVYT